MKIENGTVVLTKKDITKFEKEFGFQTSWHTPYYINSCGLKSNTGDYNGNYPFIGFGGWLKNANVYIFDKEIYIKDIGHLNEIFQIFRDFKTIKDLENKMTNDIKRLNQSKDKPF